MERKADNAEFWAIWREQTMNGGPFNIGYRQAWSDYYDAHPEAIDEFMRAVNIETLSHHSEKG